MSPARPKLETLLTIIFTPHMGARMRWARMGIGRTQIDVAILLLVAPSTISKIETGRMKVTHMFSYAKFLEVFGDATNYILTGAGASRYERNSLASKFYRQSNERGHNAKLKRAENIAAMHKQARKMVEQELREARRASDKIPYVRDKDENEPN